MKKLQKYSLLFILAMISGIFFGELKHGYSQGVTFQKCFGTAGTESGSAIIQTADGGYAMTGSITGNGFDVLFVKTDALGNIQLQKVFGGAGDDYGNSIFETSDGGYLILSRTKSFGAGNDDALLIKLDASGNLEWAKTYGLSNYEQPRIIRATMTGNIIIAGTTNSAGAGGTDIMILALDANGNILLQKAYGGIHGELPYQVDFTMDGGLAIVGFRHDYVSEREVLLIKTGNTGNVQWAKVYRDGLWNIGQSIEDRVDISQRIAGVLEYYISGYTTSYGAGNEDIFVFKTDSAGSILWSNTYGGSGTEYSRGVAVTATGLLVPGFTTSFGSGGGDIYLLSLDFDGNLLGSRTYGGANSDMVVTEATDNMLQFTGDGGMILLSATQSFGAGGSDVYLVKTGLDGSSGCNESDTTATVVGSAPFNTFSITPTVTNLGLTTTSPSLNVVTPALQENIMCTNINVIDAVIKFEGDTGGTIFDRFGNRYSPDQIKRKTQGQTKTVTCANSIFELDFTGTFFTSADANGNTPADVITDVFCYISNIIQPTLCGGQSPTVYFNIYTENLPDAALAGASSYYQSCCPGEGSGIIDGDVWEAINACGNDCPENDSYDGLIVIDNVTWTWNLDDNATIFTGYDLYSVMLHEVTHALGFTSLITEYGTSTGGYFSRYDWHLFYNNNHVLDWDGCYDASVNQFNAITASGCSTKFKGTLNLDAPVYTPNPYKDGSSLSHFE